MVTLPPPSSLSYHARTLYAELLILKQEASEAEAEAYEDEGNKALMRYAVKLEKAVTRKEKAVLKAHTDTIKTAKKDKEKKEKREKAKVNIKKKQVLKAVKKIAPNVCVPPKTVKVAPRGYTRAGNTVKGYCRRPPRPNAGPARGRASA